MCVGCSVQFNSSSVFNNKKTSGNALPQQRNSIAMKTIELVKTFNLYRDVDEFVLGRVKSLATSQIGFSFAGHNTSCACGVKEPHVPHERGTYSTVRNGELEYFCLGIEGEVEGQHLHIVVEKYRGGSPESAARTSGYSFFTPDEEKLPVPA